MKCYTEISKNVDPAAAVVNLNSIPLLYLRTQTYSKLRMIFESILLNNQLELE